MRLALFGGVARPTTVTKFLREKKDSSREHEHAPIKAENILDKRIKHTFNRGDPRTCGRMPLFELDRGFNPGVKSLSRRVRCAPARGLRVHVLRSLDKLAVCAFASRPPPSVILSSSAVERSAVNRLVVGSNPTSGASCK